jgi:3'-phosphoadenosine 5'-phosphosulfate (PAPS) 3'-phosphatase
MAASTPKIFGIGLSKTGTTSLANALQILGYKTKDNIGVVKYAAGDLSSMDLNVVDAHDAVTDTPIPSFYRELDATYPGSKFILTVRDSKGWSTSCRKQFTRPHTERQNEAHRRLFSDLYGTDVFEEEGFASGYRRFVDGVRDYFKGRPQDLLVLDVSGGEGWEKLCAFLNRPVPDIPFPKANVTQIRWMSIDDVVAVAKQGGVELMRRFNGRRGLGAQGDAEHSPAHTARSVFNAALQALRVGDSVEVAVKKGHKVIAAGLTKLNSRIPVVSRASDLVPYQARRQWNHCWLVDPLDGEAAFARGSEDFSVNIALIEDGQPICGVVHVPATDTTYYGQAGKGAYRCTRGQQPIPLAQTQGPWQRAQTNPTTRPDEGSSRALAMCMLAEGKRSTESILEPAMEWRTAAADAILRSVGLCICDAASGRELVYNNQDLANGAIKIATFPADPAGSGSQIRE